MAEAAKRYTVNGEPLFYAYSTVFEGMTTEIKSHACWFVPKVDVAEMGEGGFPIVNIIAESGLIFPHAIGEFTPGEPEAPARGEVFYEPI
jgi:hypothetical protein